MARDSHPSAQFRLLGAALLGAALLVGAVVAVQTQVDVVGTSDGDGRRSCGSALDALTGRSGWERWWSADLDELPAGQPSQLTRTERCPDAINRHLWLSGVLVVGSMFALGSVAWARPRGEARGGTDAMRRLGMSIVTIGALLTVGGAVALVVLVADPSSTLFIYVDRLVVSLVGLIVLVPALALIAIGRAIVLVSDRVAEDPRQP